MLIVSAGYDALDADELATASLQPQDYGRCGQVLEHDGQSFFVVADRAECVAFRCASDPACAFS